MTIHETDEPPVDPSDLEEDDVHDVSAAGHLWLRQQRRVLQYMRLIEHEVPQLVRKSSSHVLLTGVDVL